MKNGNSIHSGFTLVNYVWKVLANKITYTKIKDKRESNVVHSLAPLLFLFLSLKLRIWLVYLIPWSIMTGLPLISLLISSLFSFTWCRIQDHYLPVYTKYDTYCSCYITDTGKILFFICLSMSNTKNEIKEVCLWELIQI